MAHFRFIFGPLTIALAAAIIVPAQNESPAQSGNEPTRATAHPSTVFGFVPAGMMIYPKPHAPFSAIMTEQIEQTLADGTTINRESEQTVMRDSEGRVYRARKIAMAGHPDREPRLMVTIIDPVQHVQYICSPVKVCRRVEYREPQRRLPTGYKSRDKSVEDLGTSNISGLEVHGRRITRTIPAEEIGNDRALTTVEETWRSEELDIDVQVKHSDPRMGNRTTTITSVNPGEPDAAYFQPPEGYKVVEGMPTSTSLAPALSEAGP